MRTMIPHRAPVRHLPHFHIGCWLSFRSQFPHFNFSTFQPFNFSTPPVPRSLLPVPLGALRLGAPRRLFGFLGAAALKH